MRKSAPREVKSESSPDLGGFLATPDVQSPVTDDHGPHAEEIERLRLLLEASSTLLGSLKVDEVLPKVLQVAQTTLAADAHALWQYDEDRGTWGVAAHSGLSPDYMRSAMEA